MGNFVSETSQYYLRVIIRMDMLLASGTNYRCLVHNMRQVGIQDCYKDVQQVKFTPIFKLN